MTPSTPQSSISRLPGGLHELRLQGRFYHPHWLAFLLTGLSQNRVSVVSGRASQGEPQEWNATLRLDFRGSGAIPELLDYRALSEKPAQVTAAPMQFTPIQLSYYLINRRMDKSIEVHLKGPDQLGFLGRFLREISLLALYPFEVNVDTSAGFINDRIALNGLAGAAPSEAQLASLETMLRNLKR